MKLFLTLASVLVLGTYSYGQTQPNTTQEAEYGKYRVVTNTFGDNWFLGAAAGASVYFGDHNKQEGLGKRFTPNYNAYVGKWFSPVIGVRAGVTAGKIKGLTQNGAHSTGEMIKASEKLSRQEFDYYNIAGDVLWNLTNTFGGYRTDRFYNLSPYVGLGWMKTNDKPKAEEVSANIGIYNSFRLSGALNLTLDLRAQMVNDRFDGELGKRKQEGNGLVLLGLAYQFKKRDWDKPQNTIITNSNTTEVNDLRNKLSQLAADNDLLKKQLADASGKEVTEVIVKNRILAAPILFTFPINESTITNAMRVNLGFFAKVIKEADTDVVYVINGYADKGTGSVKTNKRLSQERADHIYDVLVNEFNVPKSQLKRVYNGGVDNMFYDDPRVSRAVIAIAE